MTALRFEVKGSRGDVYVVSAERKHGTNNLTIECDCRAGMMGQYCKHRFALIDGDVTNLLSDNTADVEKLRELVSGTDVELRLDDVRNLQAQYDGLGKRLKGAKRALARVMHD